MIKLGIRQNLFYPSMLITNTFFRQMDSLIIDKHLKKHKDSLILTLIMFLSEFILGMILFIRNINFLKYSGGKNKYIKTKNELIYGYNQKMSNKIDSQLTIYLYIILIAFFDFIEFIIKTSNLLKNLGVSDSLDTRLRSIVTISSALFCYYLLKIPIYKHHKLSLLIITICLVIIIILEYIYLNDNSVKLTKGFFLIFPDHIFNSFKDIIEKYILEYDYINPFQTLMLEGAFGIIFTCLLFFITGKTFDEIKDKYNNGECIVGFIFCQIFYFLVEEKIYIGYSQINYIPKLLKAWQIQC